MRAKFISETLSKPQFSLMRKAMLDRARHPPLYKDIPPISLGMAKRIERLERNAEKDKELRKKTIGPSMEEANRPIADLLIQGDLLLSNIQMKAYDHSLQEERQPLYRRRIKPKKYKLEDKYQHRGKRQILQDPESGFPLTKWRTDTPICYRFHPTMDNWMRTLVNEATKFWQANTCLSFKENCTIEPVVRYIRAGGCYSSVGKQFQDFEQDVSLGQKCDLFGVAAHETGHTLGLFHHQSRIDRDDHISLTENIPTSWLSQYEKVSNKTATIMDVHYDYGSDLHYPGYDLQNSKVLLAAKRVQYQHTMGNRRQPSFLDLKLVNQFYGCQDKCQTKPDCKNGGFVNPNNCSRCICPSAFGGYLCDERAPAAFTSTSNCGDSLEATSEFQMIHGEVHPAGPTDKNNITVRQAECHYHIKARPGYQIEIKVMNVTGPCTNECYYGALEIKFEEFTWTGARLCCPTHIDDIGGTMISEDNLATVSYYTQKGPLKAVIRYREIQHDEPLESSTTTSDSYEEEIDETDETEATTTTEISSTTTTEPPEKPTTNSREEEVPVTQRRRDVTTAATTTTTLPTTTTLSNLFPTLFPTVPARKLPNIRCHDIAINCAFQLTYCRSVPTQMQKYCAYSCEFCQP
ncbi:unnamed protein product [Bursaphelenchus xylophilus]|uniref:Zinc metalloproteinase n=1 Tax=Bursaphelenchus xylophilus TaxID=6326 RepID=A0A1I7SV52_BURXY|nr:unnamed protein product [Bursaphelenchus xylophilus]CAG9100909.1 unnamed protein product [Bursaphelenchus xylophilus]